MNDESRPQLLVNWERESETARKRESGLAAFILHLSFLIAVFIGPRMFNGQPLAAAELQVVRPDVTVLYLPSDVVPIPESKTPLDLTPEERRRPVVNPRLTVHPDQLRQALTPPPSTEPRLVPLTPPQQQLPTPPRPAPGGGGELQARNEPPGGDQPGASRRPVTRFQDVPQFERNADSSGLQLPQASPGRMIDESILRSQGARGKGGGAPGEGEGAGPVQPNFNTPYPTILSDTRGVDFSPYLIRLLRKIRANWYATIPESARWGEKGRVVIVFTILKDGGVPGGQPTVVATSGRSYLDRPALAAILGAKPFPPLPAEFDGDHIVLQFTFLYNLPLDYTGP